MPVRNRKPTTPSSRTTTVRDYSELSDESRRSASPKSVPIAPAAPRADQRSPQGRSAQAPVPHGRFQAGQPRGAGYGSFDPVRSEPQRGSGAGGVADGDKRYLLSPRGLRVGATVQSGPGAPIEIGNALPIGDLPLGIAIHNVELTPGRGGQLFVPQAIAPPWSRGRASTRRCGCHPGRRVWSMYAAWPPSARSATPII